MGLLISSEWVKNYDCTGNYLSDWLFLKTYFFNKDGLSIALLFQTNQASPRGQGAMNRALACSAYSRGFEKEPIIKKLHDLPSPSRKNPSLKLCQVLSFGQAW